MSRADGNGRDERTGRAEQAGRVEHAGHAERPGGPGGPAPAGAAAGTAARTAPGPRSTAPAAPGPSTGTSPSPEPSAPDGSLRRTRPSPWWALGLFRSELVTVFRRWRTLALLGVLAAVPLLIGIAVRIETGDGGSVGGGNGGGGPAFIAQITNNGLFLVFTGLAATLPLFLPMAVGVVAGDAIAGEANAGTLRYLLVAPAGRTRLLLAKFTAVLAFCLVATVTVALSALAVGAVLFPLGEVTLISGTTVSLGEGLLRALAVAAAVAASLTGVAALGLFVSTLTNSGIAAMAATVGLLITVQIVNTIPQLDAVHPYLFPHYWLSFADLLRAPVYWEDLLRNLGLQALYAAVFGSVAWARFSNRDVTV